MDIRISNKKQNERQQSIPRPSFTETNVLLQSYSKHLVKC